MRRRGCGRCVGCVGLGQYLVSGAGVPEFEDRGVAPLREQLVQVVEVLGRFDPVKHDVPLVIELDRQRRGQARADGLWIGWRDTPGSGTAAGEAIPLP